MFEIAVGRKLERGGEPLGNSVKDMAAIASSKTNIIVEVGAADHLDSMI